jgi:hypothetical protein
MRMEEAPVHMSKPQEMSGNVGSVVVRSVEHREQSVQEQGGVFARGIRQRSHGVGECAFGKDACVLGKEAKKESREEHIEVIEVIDRLDIVRANDLVIETRHPLGRLDVGIVEGL